MRHPAHLCKRDCRALLNRAALCAVGYMKDMPNPPGGEIQRDNHDNPTGLLIARPNAALLYATLAKGPKLLPEHQMNSTRHFMRELNRLGLTSIIDAGGGFQNYPEDYSIIEDLHKRGEMTLRIAYNLFTQKPKQEKEDFARWIKMSGPGKGDDFFRCNGEGEMLVFSAADFEDFLEPRPDLRCRPVGRLRRADRRLLVHAGGTHQEHPIRSHSRWRQGRSRHRRICLARTAAYPGLAGMEWSPVKAFGGYGAPLDVREAAHAHVPVAQHTHSATYHEFWVPGYDCFAY
ncbi:MAG: amidohydrolase family protein [Methylococcales bacterium]